MDVLEHLAEFVALASSLLLLLLCTHRALEDSPAEDIDDENYNDFQQVAFNFNSRTAQLDAATQVALHSFQLFNSIRLLDDDLGFWVKPRSTTWFSRFLLEQYDEDRWMKMFRMTKPAVFSLTEMLKPAIQKKDTKFRLAIPVVVCVACTLFKLAQGASLLICSEMFAVGRSSVSLLLRQVVHAITIVLRSEILWPRGEKMLATKANFKELCGLPGVVGAIDGTHIAISRPQFAPADYFYFKSGGYSMNCQALVDSQKRFLDFFVGMPGSTNDSRILKKSSLCDKATRNTLRDVGLLFSGFSPYLLGDSGYPLTSWLMVPHRDHSQMEVAEALFKKNMQRERGLVENAFGLLKQSFRELLLKSDLHVTFLHDVIICCVLLHNVLLRQSNEDVKRLLHVLQTEGYNEDTVDVTTVVAEVRDGAVEDLPQESGLSKRRDLGLYLTIQRAMAPTQHMA